MTQHDDLPADDAPTGFPEPPGKDPGDRSRQPTPYTQLNNPVGEPDPTEWPDPYDKREDPRAPADEMVFPGDGRSHTPSGATSSSEPAPDADIGSTHEDIRERDNLDD